LANLLILKKGMAMVPGMETVMGMAMDPEMETMARRMAAIMAMEKGKVTRNPDYLR
jgi:hypothetical protein